MCKCKNIECENETKNGKIYCSLTCRNYYVNKYLRDYSKNSIGLAKEATEEYDAEPKYCVNPNCNIRIPYEQRRNKFCSASCAASISNLGRVISDDTKNKLKKTWDLKLKELNIKTITPCKNCGIDVKIKNRKLYCSNECKKEYFRKDMDKFLIYKKDASFKFSLNQYPNEFDFSLIEKHGWYSPSNSKKPNTNGVSRDHMVSIREGFSLGIDPSLLAHPANCKLMVHNDNISKNKKCSLTIIELNDRINEWNIKYNILGNTLIG
jgi:hypothetical protein